MIEKCIGRFPTYMKTESPHGNKYFQYSNDQIDVKYEKLSSKSKKYVDKIVPFEEYFTINSNDRNSGIVSFMKEIMAVCPRNRYFFCIFINLLVNYTIWYILII